MRWDLDRARRQRALAIGDAVRQAAHVADLTAPAGAPPRRVLREVGCNTCGRCRYVQIPAHRLEDPNLVLRCSGCDGTDVVVARR